MEKCTIEESLWKHITLHTMQKRMKTNNHFGRDRKRERERERERAHPVKTRCRGHRNENITANLKRVLVLADLLQVYPSNNKIQMQKRSKKLKKAQKSSKKLKKAQKCSLAAEPSQVCVRCRTGESVFN
jgi:hypothetical protein